MKIIIETIDHEQQRYSTIGDWYYDYDGTMRIKVSNIQGNYQLLVAVHELIEAILCLEQFVPQALVDEFDLKYEEERQQGKHPDGEPGDDPRAPYYLQHKFASRIEKQLAKQLNVNWKKYLKSM